MDCLKTRQLKIVVIIGTRPEAIKMCPLIIELKKHKECICKVCLTGQHKEMLNQVMDAFDMTADYNLSIMRDNQSLTNITSAVLEELESVFLSEDFDLVLVHGDTTTSFAAALAAFYHRIPVGHVEAGLRTGKRYSPFPEEMNRLLTDRLCTYYFAPTVLNQQNLNSEGVFQNVYVTGNTVIDAFKYTIQVDWNFNDFELRNLDFEHHKVIMITAHRRENLGQPLRNICGAILRLAQRYSDAIFVYPVHLNPIVRSVVFEMLSNVPNIILLEPLDVLDMHNLLSRCYMVLTDSGGLQEEAPYLGKPVLVLRTETERPEAVNAGTVKVIGVEEENIYQESKVLLEDEIAYKKMALATSPYGDGNASQRIAAIIIEELMKAVT